MYAIAQQVGIETVWSGPIDPRPISSIGQANNLGAYLDLVVVAVLGLWVGAGQRGRMALAVVGAVSVIAIGLTLSRGAYLALAAVGRGAMSARTYRANNGGAAPSNDRSLPCAGLLCSLLRLALPAGHRRSRGSLTARSPRRMSPRGRSAVTSILGEWAWKSQSTIPFWEPGLRHSRSYTGPISTCCRVIARSSSPASAPRAPTTS